MIASILTILFILLAGFVIVLSLFSNLLITILDWLARPFRRRKPDSASRDDDRTHRTTVHTRSGSGRKKKIIDSDDGEYVDFEEL